MRTKVARSSFTVPKMQSSPQLESARSTNVQRSPDSMSAFPRSKLGFAPLPNASIRPGVVPSNGSSVAFDVKASPRRNRTRFIPLSMSAQSSEPEQLSPPSNARSKSAVTVQLSSLAQVNGQPVQSRSSFAKQNVLAALK